MYRPKRPLEKKNIIVDYTKLKVPYFFIYAKDKEKHKVEENNDSVVNRIGKIIKNPRLTYECCELKKFNYKMLMNNSEFEDCKIVDKIIKKYIELDLNSHFMINRTNDKANNALYIYQSIRKNILGICNDEKYVVDVLVQYLYKDKKSSYKTTLWECFGDVIVENLKNNLTKNFKNRTIHCDNCGILIEAKSGRTKYCESCAKEMQLEWQRKSMKKLRNHKM